MFSQVVDNGAFADTHEMKIFEKYFITNHCRVVYRGQVVTNYAALKVYPHWLCAIEPTTHLRFRTKYSRYYCAHSTTGELRFDKNRARESDEI
jgi:hypothetical protein